MLDLKFIRENPEKVRKALKDRGMSGEILENLLHIDAERRALLRDLEDLRHQRNLISEEISKLLQNKENSQEKIMEAKKIGEDVDRLEGRLSQLDEKLKDLLLNIPNIPHESVPVGTDSSYNKVVRTWGEPKEFDFTPRTHLELGEYLDIIDFPRAAKLVGSNFALFKGDGARLQRALIDFMLDLHTKKHRYKEIWPPALVNRMSMTATGQLPKLELDMYRLRDDDFFLIPTAEVPVTNLHRDEILEEEKLPLYYTAYTPCFRREAGSYGKDTKGLVRVHQFDKIELVKFTKPEDSYKEHEMLVRDAEEVLQLLGLSYRTVLLSTGDLSFAGAKCYDLEAWAPGLGRYLEVSSCSNFEDFQARRANIRFRTIGGKIAYVHTLNGSGLAVGRTLVAILENYQEKDGTVVIPEALRPYMHGLDRIIPSIEVR
ncbi:MAG: serine--tRNA ligase [Candidatus Omnitrophica bacterium]|nr:serine--tRNA ligase [Candidatus Omnitrophota bacterium]